MYYADSSGSSFDEIADLNPPAGGGGWFMDIFLL
jgi:hypothetical protein